MGWLQSLAAEFPITLTDGAVWLSIGQGLLFSSLCLLLGVWVARLVGLLASDAQAGETLGVGLASGLLVLTACWAAVASGGRSSFTPLAVGLTIAIGLAGVRWRRSHKDVTAIPTSQPGLATNVSAEPSIRRRNLFVAVLGGASFFVATALLYGSTLTLSPRDGVQPLEFNDEAFYSILGADLAKTGTETIYSPSGFAVLEELPTQTWYHWGELWLASAVITIFDTAPLLARNLIVLPLMLFAAAALTGTLVRRMTGSASRGAFVFGFFACLFLAPMPLIPGPFFSSFARGMIFGITAYGLAAVAVLLAMYSLTVLARREATWALATFVGSATALILPAHIVIAVLGLVGIGGVWTVWIAQSLLTTRQFPPIAPVWRQPSVATGIAIVATIAWGLLTGHGVGGSGLSSSVAPFNESWRESVAITVICSGAFLAIAVAWFMVRRKASMEASLYLGTAVLLVTGAFVWGARLGDLATVHLFFGGIAVFATPVAAIAVWSTWVRLRAIGRARLAIAVLVLSVVQIGFGAIFGVVRLEDFGPRSYPPVPLGTLATIRNLPPDAKLAYACQPSEEVAFWLGRLLGLDAHAGRRVVPMCFEAETDGQLNGTKMSADIPSPLFESAPQRMVYPDSSAHPSSASIAAFLKANGINYIYADAQHPNNLVPDAILVTSNGGVQVLRLP